MTITDGWHTATITGYGLSGEPTRESAQFAIGFQIEGGGTITFYGGFRSDAAKDFTEKTLHKCGWNGDYVTPELTDKPVRILVETEEYNGKSRQKVKAISDKTGGGSIKRMDTEGARAFVALLSGKPAPRMSESRPAWGKSDPKRPPPREPGDDYDDIPFG